MSYIDAERVAKAWFEAREQLAPKLGLRRMAGRGRLVGRWRDVPGREQKLMVEVARKLLENGVIKSG